MAVERRVRGASAESADSKNELEKTMAAIRKQYGDPSISLSSSIEQPWRIPTDVFMLDMATLGGVPYNRVTTIVGERHSGKTMLATKIAASSQRMFEDDQVAIIDVEGTWESVWAAKLGLDNDRALVMQPETGESAVDVADALVRTKGVSLVLVDSIAALTPMKEIEDSSEDAHVGLQARLVGVMVRKLTSSLLAERQRGHYVTVLLLNQFRTKVGQLWGDPRTMPGGKALEFCASLHLIIKNKEEVGKDEYGVETVTHNVHSFDIKKNKMNGGIRTGEFTVLRVPNAEFGLSEGAVDDASTMLAYAKKFNIYTGGGSSWRLAFDDVDFSFRGVADTSRALYDDGELYWKLRNALIRTQAEHLGFPDSFLQRF